MYYNHKLVNIVHPQTSLTTTLRKTTGKSIHGSETPFSLAATTAAENIVLGDNYYSDIPHLVE